MKRRNLFELIFGKREHRTKKGQRGVPINMEYRLQFIGARKGAKSLNRVVNWCALDSIKRENYHLEQLTGIRKRTKTKIVRRHRRARCVVRVLFGFHLLILSS